jgi:HPt (histidine-containing phosphotransfer) domain-containing protein
LNERALFDREAMLERMGGDADLLGEIVELFLEDGPRVVERLRGAVARGDADEIERAAHSLKGALLNMSANPLAALALELENLGREGELARCGGVLEALETKMVRLREQLRRIR